MNLGPTELLIVLAVVLLLFGSTRLPKLARSMGQASKEFKQGIHEGGSEDAPRRADDKVTLSRAEYDALAEREAEARRRPPTV